VNNLDHIKFIYTTWSKKEF